jgi:uncharacterized protein
VKIVLDTNILVSAYLWDGKPSQVWAAVLHKQAEAITSPTLVEEFADVVNRKKFQLLLEKKGKTAEAIIQQYQAIAYVVHPASIPDIARDPDDNHVLACAETGQADYIVTSDDDLLSLGSYREIKIVNAQTFLQLLEETE